MDLTIHFKNNALLSLPNDKKNARTLQALMKRYPRHYNKILKSTYPELEAWIINKTPGLDDPGFSYPIGLRIFWIFNGFTDFPKCPVCGGPIGKRKKKYFHCDTGLYIEHCSEKCSSLDPCVQAKNKKTNTKLYGCNWPMQSEDVMDKSIKSSRKKYGTDRPTQSKVVQDHIKNTCLEKYGVTNVFKAECCKTTIKDTMKKRYGVEHCLQCHEFFCKAQKRYTYHGICFASAPEIAYYIWLTDHGIKFEYQPKSKQIAFEYNGKRHYYMPDFWLIDSNEIHEIKGDFFFADGDPTKEMIYPYRGGKTAAQLKYLDGLAEAKHKCMIENHVKILTKHDYDIFFDYISEKYGKDYLKSYKVAKE